MSKVATDQHPDEISLREIAQVLWDRRMLIAIVTIAMLVLAAGVSLVLPIKYEAHVVLSPVEDDKVAGKLGGAGALLAQFGGLAGLGGLGNSGKKAEAIAILSSAALTETFIRENNLLPVLYADRWDPEQKAWKEKDADDTPTLWKAESLFRRKIRTINEDKKTGLVDLTIRWSDARLAASWANEIAARANAYIRNRAIEESERNLAYLKTQLAQTTVVEIQSAIYELTESEIKNVMIAKGREEYAFRVIDPARVAEKRSSPQRLLITALGAFLGLIFGVILALSLPAHAPAKV